MKRVGAFEHLRLKEHTHTFINEGGRVGMLDFRISGTGAPSMDWSPLPSHSSLKSGQDRQCCRSRHISCSESLFDFDGALQDIRNLDNISFSTGSSVREVAESIDRLWDPICYALGFLDCDNTSARCMLTIFQLFAVRSEASVLRM